MFNEIFIPVTVILLVCFTGSEGSTCYSISPIQQWFECEYGCCGPELHEYCCFALSDKTIKVAIAVGGVLGGLVLLAGLLALFCMCTKTQTKGGRVVAPAAYGGPSVEYSGSSGQYPMQPMGPQLPPYTAATAPPPSYSYTTPSATWAGAGMPSASAP